MPLKGYRISQNIFFVFFVKCISLFLSPLSFASPSFFFSMMSVASSHHVSDLLLCISSNESINIPSFQNLALASRKKIVIVTSRTKQILFSPTVNWETAVPSCKYNICTLPWFDLNIGEWSWNGYRLVFSLICSLSTSVCTSIRTMGNISGVGEEID